MKRITLFTTLVLLYPSAYANWVCSVAHEKGVQWSVAAPDESTAEAMAERVCASNHIEKKSCSPDCYDNGASKGRWHCVVTNAQGQNWSYFAPTKQQASQLAQHGCNTASLTPIACKPACIPE